MSVNDLDEDKAVAEVVDRLAERFPTIPRSHVDEVVQNERRALDGKPIRDYIPVLVEHGAKARLREEVTADA
jgi:hypothetical protein